MIRLAEITKTFLPDLEQKYGHRLLPSHRQALTAIEPCRTQALGTAAIHCDGCDRHEVFPLSCGHRFCPQCQHEAGETWLERQRAKLLPADDYLITFTLPATLLALVYDHQREAYDLLIRLAWQTRPSRRSGGVTRPCTGTWAPPWCCTPTAAPSTSIPTCMSCCPPGPSTPPPATGIARRASSSSPTRPWPRSSGPSGSPR